MAPAPTRGSPSGRRLRGPHDRTTRRPGPRGCGPLRRFSSSSSCASRGPRGRAPPRAPQGPRRRRALWGRRAPLRSRAQPRRNWAPCPRVLRRRVEGRAGGHPRVGNLHRERHTAADSTPPSPLRGAGFHLRGGGRPLLKGRGGYPRVTQPLASCLCLPPNHLQPPLQPPVTAPNRFVSHLQPPL